MSGARFQGDLPERTLKFALAVVQAVRGFGDGTLAWVLGKQLLRSGTSIGANVREAEHALSDAEFVQRCSVARKEAAETLYWIQLCSRSGLLQEHAAATLHEEADALLRILSSIVRKTQRGNLAAFAARSSRRGAPEGINP